MEEAKQLKSDLSKFDNSWYSVGASRFKWALWFICNGLFVLNPLNPFNSIRKFVLRAFGAKIGPGVIIKPGVQVKFPWHLEVGAHSWIGERAWIENHVLVKIGANSCLSQGAMLLCGNHNYKKQAFDLMVGTITLEEGVWIGAKAVVTAGVTCKSHSVLTVSSVTSKDLEPYTIYAGNPAQAIRKRNIIE